MKLFKPFVITLTLVLTTVGIFATTYAQGGGDAARGAQLFAKNCVVCHGERAEGRVGATLAKDFPGIRVDALLKEIISNGVQGSVMPAWSISKGGPMSDAEIDDVVAYIRSLGHQAPTVLPGPAPTQIPLPPPAVKFPTGDATRGATVFAQNCLLCHGEKGEGRIGATLQKDWPGINVDSFLDTTVARGVAGSKMPAWAKSNGGPLSDQEIADAVAYVRTLKPGTQPTAVPASVPQGGPLGGTLALVCIGLLILLGVIVLAVVLAGSRAKPQQT